MGGTRVSNEPPLPAGDPLGACRGLASAMLIVLALAAIAAIAIAVLRSL